MLFERIDFHRLTERANKTNSVFGMCFISRAIIISDYPINFVENR